MIKPLLRQKEKELVAKPKAIIPFRSVTGAALGILTVLFLSIFARQIDMFFVWVILQAPGMIAFREVNMLTDIKSSMSRYLYYEVFANFVIYGTSSIPPALVGWMLGSSKQWTRSTGFTILVLCISISIVAGIFIYAVSI